MTSVEPTEIEELRGPVLGIIGAYGMGVSLDPRELYLKTAPPAPPPEPVPVPPEAHQGRRRTKRGPLGAGSIQRAPSEGDPHRRGLSGLDEGV